ncbi:unnamed protein product, partial [Prorocentrum cordatum]
TGAPRRVRAAAAVGAAARARAAARGRHLPGAEPPRAACALCRPWAAMSASRGGASVLRLAALALLRVLGAAGGGCSCDLDLQKVGHNNLGAKGPDPSDTEPTLVFKDVCSPGGEPVDLVIEVMGDYATEDSYLNGKNSKGPYGTINLEKVRQPIGSHGFALECIFSQDSGRGVGRLALNLLVMVMLSSLFLVSSAPDEPRHEAGSKTANHQLTDKWAGKAVPIKFEFLVQHKLGEY